MSTPKHHIKLRPILNLSRNESIPSWEQQFFRFVRIGIGQQKLYSIHIKHFTCENIFWVPILKINPLKWFLWNFWWHLDFISSNVYALQSTVQNIVYEIVFQPVKCNSNPSAGDDIHELSRSLTCSTMSWRMKRRF